MNDGVGDLEITTIDRIEDLVNVAYSGNNLANCLQKVDERCCEKLNKVVSIDYPGDRGKATINIHYMYSFKVFVHRY